MSQEAEDKLRKSLRTTFDQFDADASGAIDAKEIEALMQSLGMLMDAEALAQMVKEADTDGSGEIEFDEFYAVMAANIANPKSGGEFAALINRKENSGPALKWKTDPQPAGCEVGGGGDVRRLSKVGDSWSAQMLDMFIRTGQAQAEHLKERYDCCDVLLRCDKLPGEAYFGIVSGNFTSINGEEKPWDSKQMISFASTSGELYRKGKMDQYAKMCPVKEGDLIQVETRMSKGEVTFKVFDARNKLKASQTCGEIAFLNTFAVALGPVPADGGAFELILVGSSCEKSEVMEMEVNEVMSAEKRNAADGTMGAAMAMA